MKYVEGVDYWVYSVEFPNMASPSVAVSNGDGTFSIYLNSRFPPDKRSEGLRHELEHLEGEHFYRDDLELMELEAAADGKLTLPAPASRRKSSRGARYVPCFKDTGEYLEYFLRRASPESLRMLRRAGLLPGAGENAAH